MASAAGYGEHLPVFVYGTLQTGFKNHANVVKGAHSRVEVAHLAGAAVFHFATGFPGAYPVPGMAPEALLELYEPRVLANLQAMLRSAPPPATRVVGQLLHFSPERWPVMLRDMDCLEAFSVPRARSNMYERVLVSVEAVPPPTADDTASTAPTSSPVRAWTYLCLMDPAQVTLSSSLVVSGDWRAHMALTGLSDAADDWDEGLPRRGGASAANNAGEA